MNILYHGSNVEVPHPRIPQNAFYKDFGYGFYCNLSEKHAKRWAITKKGESVVNFDENSPDVDLIQLEKEIQIKENYDIYIEDVNENYVLMV